MLKRGQNEEEKLVGLDVEHQSNAFEIGMWDAWRGCWQRNGIRGRRKAFRRVVRGASERFLLCMGG